MPVERAGPVNVPHLVEFLLLKLLQAALWMLPWSAVRSLGRWAGRVLFSRLGFRRNVTVENIAAAFPECSHAQHIVIAADSFESVGVTLMEFLLFPRLRPEDLRSLVHITNPEVLRAAISKQNGVILLTAHYGSWELFGQAAGLEARSDGRLLMKVQSNTYVASEVDRWRTRFGLLTTPSTLAVRDVLGTLQQGGWVVIAADQSAPKESVPVRFFGREVPTFQGPAAFALKTGATILLGVARRTPADTYEITFEKIPGDDLHGATQENIRLLTERHVRRTEELIRREPGQWMWMHKRWKHV